MDPDMVRQQEEEEAASRAHQTYRPQPVLHNRPSAPAASIPDAHIVEAVPSFMKQAAPTPQRVPGWGGALMATSYGLAFGALGLTAGIMLGVKLQLVGWQGMLLGTGAGFLLGWRAAGGALRQRYDLPARKAYGIPIGPMAVMLFLIVAAMLLKVRFGALISAETALSDEQTYWAMIGSGALLGFIFAFKRMRRGLQG